MTLYPRLRTLLKVGIRHRLIALMAIAALALAFDSYLTVVLRRDQRVEEVKARMLLVAQNAADHQYQFASAARLLLGIVTKVAPSADACGNEFRKLATEAKWLKAISVADANGILVCSSAPFEPGTNLADRAYFKDAVRTRAFVMSDYVMGRVRKAPVVLAAAPRLKSNNEVDSVVILSIDLSWLNQIAENIGAGEDANVILVDSTATVVSADRKARSLTGQSLARDPMFRRLVASRNEVLAGAGPDGVSRLYASAQLSGTGARLIIGFPESQLLTPVHEAAKNEFLKNTLFFLALFTIAWMLAERMIVRPIRTLTHAASAFGNGDRKARVDPDALPNDFTELAETFNTTADLLARNEELIVEKNCGLAEANTRLCELARADELTGLANRRVLNERLQEVFRLDTKEDVALLVLDLDKFKPVNDLMGHPVGDLVLKEVARRLSALKRGNDCVARLGGDEFAMLVACGEEKWRPRQAAKDIIRAMSRPFPVVTGQVEIGSTVGIALSERDASGPDELLRAADLAMYRAKRDERGGFRFFEPDMHAELQTRVTLEMELRAGIKAGEIIPYYQPLVDLKDGRIVGLEILARWNHPSKGILPPGVFIGVAAEVGLTEAMTRHVLGAACREAKNWPADITLSINLSPNQLSDPLLPTMMASIAMDCGIPPHRLEVEITEDALILDFPMAQAVMQSFRNLGIKIALDDFGTGYSSLQNLHELRFDKIKIDRSFIADLATNDDSRKLVSTILALAQNLGLPVTAEGIEDLAVVPILLRLGCTYGQGYAFGRPMPATDINVLLQEKAAAGRARVA